VSTSTRIYDLTLPIAHGMDAFPGEPTATFTRFSTIEDGGIEMWAVGLFSQLGTHVDAPRHFLADAATVESLDLSACIGPATVLDVPDDRDVSRADVLARAEQIRDTGRLLLRSGWSRRYGSSGFWAGFPEIGPDIADVLVDLGVRFLGIDTPTPSVAHLHDVHRRLLGAGTVIAECLTGLEQLSTTTYLVCLPLPLVGLDGAPARIVAIEPAPRLPENPL